MNEKEMDQILYKRLDIIYKYLMKIGLNKEDAEDIIQETAYRFLLHFEIIETKKAKSWLFKVALNLYYDLLRRGKKNVNIELENLNLIEKELTEEIVINNENIIEIKEIFNLLTPTFKHLLVLKYELELSYKDIADLLGVNENSIKTYLYRARQQFKAYYKEGYHGK